MKKKEHITLHKNLQNGKTQPTERRTINHLVASNRALLQKNSDKPSRKLLSQQNLPTKKRSHSKNSSKDNNQINSNLAKKEKSKSKKKSQTVKASKKSIKRHNSQDQNSIASARINNIYTKVQKPKKKKTKYTDHQSSQGLADQPSLTSITQSMKSEANRQDVQKLVEEMEEHQFANLHKLKLHVLNFIFKNRIIRDEQYDRLYQLMVEKFPDREDVCRSILFQIVSSLDS